MSIILQSSGGGSVTIQEPVTASNFTATLPAATGTIAVADGSGNLSVTGNLSFNSGYGSVATAYGCRAWVNFNGTGTVAIRASGNVSSITDLGTGEYRVNFATSMPDGNYSVVAGAAKNDGNNDGNFKAQVSGFNNGASNANSTTSTTVITGNTSPSNVVDSGVVTVAIFR